MTTVESCQRKDISLTQLLANKTSQHQYHHILFVITLRNTAIRMKTLDPKDLFFYCNPTVKRYLRNITIKTVFCFFFLIT